MTADGGNPFVSFSYDGPEVTTSTPSSEPSSEPTTTAQSATTIPGPSGAYGSSLSDTTSSLSSSLSGTVTVHGSGFKADSDVTVTLHSAPVVIGTAHTNAQGSFVATYTLPKSAALGAHQIILDGVNTNGDATYIPLALSV